jgi:hypothetical protein
VLLLPLLSCVDAWENEELVFPIISALLRPTVATVPVGFLLRSALQPVEISENNERAED